MEIKRKGKKVHPSPPQTTATTPPPSSSATRDSLSVLNLLPAAIFALLAALSFQDREVLAYMITRSLKTTTTTTTTTTSIKSSSLNHQEELKKAHSLHKSPAFDCECFECYTSFWFRWDSSSNREIIHQAIEAFEEHLASGELEMKRKRRNKKRDKLPLHVQFKEAPNPPIVNEETVPEKTAERRTEIDLTGAEDDGESAAATARKALPGVLGVLNSRLWNLWGPNV